MATANVRIDQVFLIVPIIAKALDRTTPKQIAH